MAGNDQSTARPIEYGHAQRQLAYNGQSALLQRSEGTSKKEKETLVRISKSTLPSGNELVLMTDLNEEINTKELANLYYQRWKIEKNIIH